MSSLSSYTVAGTDGPTVLMERSNAGLRVELVYRRDLDVVGIRVTDGDQEPLSADVSHADAMDAFNHPYLYV